MYLDGMARTMRRWNPNGKVGIMAEIMRDVRVRLLVQKWLGALGVPDRNADSVCQVLKDAGIKGKPLRASDCPIALYLNAQFVALDLPYRVMVGDCFITVRERTGDLPFFVDVLIPEFVRDFITAFDKHPGFAPELREVRV